jgi:predicted acylesterase/phospholipase RssA
LLVCLSACQTVPTKTYDVRQRAFTYQPTSLVRDYQEEYAYIQERREAVAHGQSNGLSDHPPTATTVPANLTGLAFSAGGIRSATFHLGVLQALHDMQRLPKIDYLSTVS